MSWSRVLSNNHFAVVGRRVVVICVHLCLWSAAYVGAYLLRFEGNIPGGEVQRAGFALGLLLALQLAAFWFSSLFHGILRYAGIPEVKSIVRATTVATVLLVVAGMAIPLLRIPRSVYVGQWLLSIAFASGLRLCVRMLRERRTVPDRSQLKRALLLGAGDAGELFLRDLARIPKPEITVVAALDDDPSKHRVRVRGVRVLGEVNDRTLRRAIEDTDARLAILAMPSVSGTRVRQIVTMCQSLGLETKTVPGLQQILSGQSSISTLRDVAIEDLLRREPAQLDESSMARLLRGKRVLVTGGAGSIGSELARQVLGYGPAVLAVLDHNENALFFLERELSSVAQRAQLRILVGDVKDPSRISAVLRDVRPHVILHAAAHKHVPMMEANPSEAIKNNVFGTRIVADLALAHGVESFVLISTDKAVNPTSIMGASKRIAELYVQSLSRQNRTRFVAVRFGNVLGSAGSVVQIFREQIASGGPVTVTHPDMRRFFMTVPEACQLVLQAGAMGEGGEIFILDMGEPVKIVDLAKDMIRMSGFEPGADIDIEFSGVRPGEKLYEELMLDGESHDRTVHPKILVGRIPGISAGQAKAAMDRLEMVIDERPDEVRRAVSALVPEAHLGGGRVLDTGEVERALRELAPATTLAVRPSA